MTELFTHTLDVPTWFAIFVVCLLFWFIATSYAWYTEVLKARAVLEIIVATDLAIMEKDKGE